PAIEPIAEPIIVTAIMDTKPMVNDTRPPKSVRVKTSRPSASVPSQYSPDGGKFISDKLTLEISFVVIYGAKKDNKIINNRKPKLIIASLFFMNFFRAIVHVESYFF